MALCRGDVGVGDQTQRRRRWECLPQCFTRPVPLRTGSLVRSRKRSSRPRSSSPVSARRAATASLCVSSGNYEKVRTAPITAIVAYDREFFELLPRLYPHTDARGWFTTDAALAEETAFRNSSLQGAYFILALRAQGLDCGPMSGFDADRVDAAFFPDGRYRANFLLNIGYGERDTLRPRLPRLRFDEVARWE